MTDRIIKAEVITFEPTCTGIFLDWESGRKSAYSVATITDAFTEFQRLGIMNAVPWSMKVAA